MCVAARELNVDEVGADGAQRGVGQTLGQPPSIVISPRRAEGRDRDQLTDGVSQRRGAFVAQPVHGDACLLGANSRRAFEPRAWACLIASMTPPAPACARAESRRVARFVGHSNASLTF